MQNSLTTSEALFHHFQVEELEERLENKWGSDNPARCPSHQQRGADLEGGDSCDEEAVA